MQNKTKVKTGKSASGAKEPKKSLGVEIAQGHHVKVPIDPKEMFKMHVSHMIIKNLGLMK